MAEKQHTTAKRKRGPGKPFKAGQSGNPNGRPKKALCITSQLKEVLDDVPLQLPNGTPNKDKLTWARIIAEQAVREAAKGSASILKEILDRSEGKVADKLQAEVDVMPPEEAARLLGLLDARRGGT